jgi:hypothetical protein
MEDRLLSQEAGPGFSSLADFGQRMLTFDVEVLLG